MILYKYYGNEAGKKALISRNLGFRKPHNFNDPFELSFLSNSAGQHSNKAEFMRTLDLLRNTVAILSLTRSPSNPLMWAHYGQDHTGFVVGYDVSDDFLSSQEYNLIPASSGDVVYTSTKTPHILDPSVMDRIKNISLSSMGELDKIRDPDTLSLARKIFLTKHACWAYEEEVRIVKILDSIFEESANYCADVRRSHYTLLNEHSPHQSQELVPGLSIFNFQIPIKEVYLGLRNPAVDDLTELESIAGARFYKFEMDDFSWELKATQLEAPA